MDLRKCHISLSVYWEEMFFYRLLDQQAEYCDFSLDPTPVVSEWPLQKHIHFNPFFTQNFTYRAQPELGILQQSSFVWIEMLFAYDSHGIEGLVTLLIFLFWILALDKHIQDVYHIGFTQVLTFRGFQSFLLDLSLALNDVFPSDIFLLLWFEKISLNHGQGEQDFGILHCPLLWHIYFWWVSLTFTLMSYLAKWWCLAPHQHLLIANFTHIW